MLRRHALAGKEADCQKRLVTEKVLKDQLDAWREAYREKQPEMNKPGLTKILTVVVEDHALAQKKDSKTWIYGPMLTAVAYSVCMIFPQQHVPLVIYSICCIL